MAKADRHIILNNFHDDDCLSEKLNKRTGRRETISQHQKGHVYKGTRLEEVLKAGLVAPEGSPQANKVLLSGVSGAEVHVTVSDPKERMSLPGKGAPDADQGDDEEEETDADPADGEEDADEADEVTDDAGDEEEDQEEPAVPTRRKPAAKSGKSSRR